MLKINLNAELSELSFGSLQKTLPSTITKKFLAGKELEFYNKTLDLCFDEYIQNQFIAALHKSFSDHHPFVLNPDDIWLIILQGLSIHINKNSEHFRDKFVDFDGKKDIVVRHDGLVKGSQDNTWSLVFPVFETAINDFMVDKELVKNIVQNFSTTLDIDKLCFQLALMDITKNYFNYTVNTLCGIPIIYIDGTKDDWNKILASAEYVLNKFELQEWFADIKPVIQKIINVFDSSFDETFFQSIYKYKQGSGGDEITGWITKFFPYIAERVGYGRNSTFSIKKKASNIAALQSYEFPSSLTSTEFIWLYYGEKFDMNFFAGFCGYDESQWNAIRPRKNFFISYK